MCVFRIAQYRPFGATKLMYRHNDQHESVLLEMYEYIHATLGKAVLSRKMSRLPVRLIRRTA